MNRTLTILETERERIVKALASIILAFGWTIFLSGCGAIDAALNESNNGDDSTPITYTQDNYLTYLEAQAVGIGPDPSGSLALSDSDTAWAQSIQALTAEAIVNRFPSLPADDAAWSGGAPGVPELKLLYMPIASISGQWNGSSSSIEMTIPAIPELSRKPQPEQDKNVTGRTGQGQAWESARETYISAYNAATAEAKSVSEEIAKFPLDSQHSDVYGALKRLADRLNGQGTIAIFSDLVDTQGSTSSPDLGSITVIAVQACTATVADCDSAKDSFLQFVADGGGQSPKVTGHEAAQNIIFNLFAYGG